MKRKVVLVLTAAFWMVLHFAAQDQERPIERVRKQFAEDLDQFQKQIRSFKVDFTAFRQGDLEQEDLQVAFAKLRFDFKRSEFLLDYLQPQDVKDHLNGAPLPKTERNAPRLVILEPKGLQTMEERVYDPKLKEQSDGFMQLIKELEYQFRISAAFAKRAQLTDRQVFEALRLGLVRVLSMGITGFDTPASDLAIEETAVTWRAFARTLQPYLEICEDAALVDEIRRKMQGAQAQLNDQSNFATFDRLRFIRNYLEPLYGLLLDLHLHLNYETAEEVYRGQLAFNYRSRSIFSEDFFNLAYFTGLEPNENIKAKAHLGRYLFFDPVLSKNFQRSCASCHKPDKAFADGLPQSLALDGKAHLDRNSPGLFNVLYAEKFFYDLRADRMETQMEHVIFSAQEFGSNYQEIFRRLESSAEYQALFRSAFPEFKGTINRHTLSQALVAFLAELKSFNSPVDRYLRGEAVQLPATVKEGFNLFMGKAACATCHFAPSFSGLVPPWFLENESEVLGVFTAPESGVVDPDRGRIAGGVVQDEAPFFKNSFKTPTVRNAAFTAPYFHNGAFPDLSSVLNFYNHGGAMGFGLDLDQQTLAPDSLLLSPTELKALEDFMVALSDTSRLRPAPLRLPELADSLAKLRLIGGKY